MDTNKCPRSFEATEPSDDAVANMCFAELIANAIVLELWATFGDQQRYLGDYVILLIEIIDLVQRESVDCYTAGKMLGYDVVDPTDFALCRAAELYFESFTY